MPTPRFKTRPIINTQPKKDWKEHPLVIAVGVAATTSIFFMTVIVPLRVELLTAKVERLTESSAKSDSIAKELERVKRELADSRAALQETLRKSPFQGRDVYPIGFNDVVLGTSEEELLKRYPGGQWDEERAFYSVTARTRGVVSEGTYFLDRRGEQSVVNKILFHLDGEETAGADLTRRHFLMNFGEPDAIRRREMLWKATDREWVVLESETSSAYGSYTIYFASAAVPTLTFKLDEK